MNRIVYFFICINFFLIHSVQGQRIYTSQSVLDNGNWYKLSLSNEGIYKIDVQFLNNIGISTSQLSSSSIHLYGNGGSVLPESNAEFREDDLKENAIMMFDGGDGIFNGSDYFLFYAKSPDGWQKDSSNKSFNHLKNIYNNLNYVFLNIGSNNGLRINNASPILNTNIIVNKFDDHVFHELDSVNFLNSGKQWYGEEFADAPGKYLLKNFTINFPNLDLSSPVIFKTNVIARSVGNSSNFNITINNQTILSLNINPVTGGNLDLFANEITAKTSLTLTQTNSNIGFNFLPGSFGAQGWLNWFELLFRNKLSFSNSSQFAFRDWSSIGQMAEFIISNATNTTMVWDVTDAIHPLNMAGNLLNNEFHFKNSCNYLHEYFTTNGLNFFTPNLVEKIPNQNLHNATAVDMIIITLPEYLDQATRLANLHKLNDSITSVIVTSNEIFNEFSGGESDITAFRDFTKMYYDKFKATGKAPKYLLLFGAASFDYKNKMSNNSNFVLGYENNISLDPLTTYTSDDFFGFLDDNEDINSGTVTNLLDIGIGRIPVKNITDAKNFVDKVFNYYHYNSFGPWRNNSVFIADDEDNNLHLQDAELISNTAVATLSTLNVNKIYLDAYKQTNGPGGSTYPDVNIDFNNQILNGALLINYNGHGGYNRLAEETILDQNMVNSWKNQFKLPVFVTATCDFAAFDNPNIQSLGENILLREKNGGIGLVTTSRVVFANSNKIMNNNFISTFCQTNFQGNFNRLGDDIKEAKNLTYQSGSDITNNRKFVLLGDPAMMPALTQNKINITQINHHPTTIIDTLRATQTTTITGEFINRNGILQSNFNGNVYVTVFDKPKVITTLGNDVTSPVTTFSSQKNKLFNGIAKARNGIFEVEFKMPLDINYQFGFGRISLYANDSIKDANGVFSNFIIGGIGNNRGLDTQGPEINLFLNNENFINYGMVNQTPILIVHLFDTSGINTTGSGIGHDLLATLDNKTYFVLNDFYRGDVNDYKKGSVQYQLPSISTGQHILKIKAWDELNNSSEKIINFSVANDENLTLSHVFNFPNPFTTKTNFWFEHNQPNTVLDVTIQIMTVTGRTIKTFIKI